MEENRNFILAIVLTMGILLGWDYFYGAPQRAAEEQALTEQAALNEQGDTAGIPAMNTEVDGTIPGMAPAVIRDFSEGREDIITARESVIIESAKITGSISLQGLRFDDVSLKEYHETVDPTSPIVTVLNPSNASRAYFGEFGWIGASNTNIALPNADTVWTANKNRLSENDSVTFSWDNGQGLVFTREVSLDSDYMFTVQQSVQNNSAAAVGLATYGRVYREGRSLEPPLFILHEGPIRVGDDGKEEISYEDLEDDTYPSEAVTEGGWAGITDKNWLVAVVPDQSEEFTTNVSRTTQNGGEQYHVNYATNGISIAPGTSATKTARFFAGAKEVELLERYTEEEGIRMFDYAIDWGWFYFFTKPIYYGLHLFYGMVGNFGVAILLLTVLIKGILFPMANKQYVSMAKMKKLAPKMKQLKERYGDDRMKMQQETMELYKKEKVNPLASCLPILIQIPIFFSLYKVLYVTIDMRHAPFIGWIKDLSAPDPLLVTNLFGLIPWDPPGFLAIGILPIFMGLTMYFQQKLNPPPPDPMQAKIFALMPILFTFILASFSVGLVIYWTWNNILTIAQQWFIMRRVAAAEESAAE